jgi:adenylosuccinate lyase
MLSQFISITSGIEFNKENISKNLDLTKGAFLAEKIMIELVKKGIGRQQGHEILRSSAIKARKEKKTLKEVLITEDIIKNNFTYSELDAMLAPENYIGKSVHQVEQMLAQLKVKYI